VHMLLRRGSGLDSAEFVYVRLLLTVGCLVNV
jgi:hypothetical protein